MTSQHVEFRLEVPENSCQEDLEDDIVTGLAVVNILAKDLNKQLQRLSALYKCRPTNAVMTVQHMEGEMGIKKIADNSLKGCLTKLTNVINPHLKTLVDQGQLDGSYESRLKKGQPIFLAMDEDDQDCPPLEDIYPTSIFPAPPPPTSAPMDIPSTSKSTTSTATATSMGDTILEEAMEAAGVNVKDQVKDMSANERVRFMVEQKAQELTRLYGPPDKRGTLTAKDTEGVDRWMEILMEEERWKQADSIEAKHKKAVEQDQTVKRIRAEQ